jgi:hypothetical protein
MQETYQAVFRDGAFVPIVPCNLPNETRVEVVVRDSPRTTPPLVTDPDERARRMKALVERMQNNPIPANAPRFTRDELHERS